MLQQITPLILTYNEAPNIGRTLEHLRWARDIVVVDSFSTDDTLEVVSMFPNARIVQREFDNHGSQWNFARLETAIDTEWILALDADYLLSSELVQEIGSLRPTIEINGYQARFTYCINGRPLRSGVYPPVTVLYRRQRANYTLDGHTHRLILEGRVETLRSRILHDDRKPLTRWLESQVRYMTLEAKKILGADPAKLSTADKLRRMRVIAPIAVVFYCLIIRGGIMDGWPGFYYAFQRMLAELILALRLLDHDLSRNTKRDEVISSREETKPALADSGRFPQ